MDALYNSQAVTSASKKIRPYVAVPVPLWEYLSVLGTGSVLFEGTE